MSYTVGYEPVIDVHNCFVCKEPIQTTHCIRIGSTDEENPVRVCVDRNNKEEMCFEYFVFPIAKFVELRDKVSPIQTH